MHLPCTRAKWQQTYVYRRPIVCTPPPPMQAQPTSHAAHTHTCTGTRSPGCRQAATYMRTGKQMHLLLLCAHPQSCLAHWVADHMPTCTHSHSHVQAHTHLRLHMCHPTHTPSPASMHHAAMCIYMQAFVLSHTHNPFASTHHTATCIHTYTCAFPYSTPNPWHTTHSHVCLHVCTHAIPHIHPPSPVHTTQSCA